ncbi:MFS transporter [Histoplasma capsulatum H143]|uniref:MFS transporter n=1 Tax=Ajellomyces capsulatus (strain H143) TaxID=544712 RepID=C6H9X8_AJECH|nr:MFS transporter [Histoplasma capsulatum H143]
MDTKTQKPKLPVQQFIVLSICRFAEPVIFTSVFPYLNMENGELRIADRVFYIGLYTSIPPTISFESTTFYYMIMGPVSDNRLSTLHTARNVCQGLTAVAWGAASDRIGRRPIIISGLCITMTFSLMFGFSTSLPMAILARACVGLGNGNVGIIRTVVAELVPEKELQPRAFSIMPLVWTIGSIFGPGFGGALADPARRHKEQFGDSTFFKKYPYALPNMAETLASKKGHQDWGLALGEILKRPFARRKEQKTPRGILVSEEDETTPLLVPPSTRTQGGDEGQKKHTPNLSWPQILIPQSNLVLLAYSTLSMHTVAFDSVFTVFLNHKLQDYKNNPDTLNKSVCSTLSTP